ncbi:MAG: RNA pseudouridine synthase [Oscillospiraceae bacterium]|nr:RNA pseudouridine synthase [Oscillospiraceae bacterium]
MEPIEILYRSHDLLICVKPAGVLSQSGTSGQKSMISLLENQTGCRVYPVHRLDREVGGVMVYALSQAAAAELSRQIQSGEMVKEYLAVTNGIPSQSEGLLTDLLFHDRIRNKTFVVDRKRKGVKEARLMYRVLQTSPSQSLIQVRLLTGRTHQIRVQFSTRGTPLSGDGRYGGGSGPLLLWAFGLTLDLPDAGRKQFTAIPSSLGSFPISIAPASLILKKDENNS